MTHSYPCDYHIHTKYLKCANETMEIAAIVQRCTELGVTSLGIADHLNSLDQLELHLPIIQDIKAVPSELDVYLGVDV